jgi:hypothetical protein
MARERDTYLDTMEDLVGHPGWRLLEAECKDRILQFQADALDGARVRSWDHICMMRGGAAILAELINLPESLRMQREQKEDSGE